MDTFATYCDTPLSAADRQLGKKLGREGVVGSP